MDGLMKTLINEKRALTGKRVGEWLSSYQRANDILVEGGFPQLRGSPVGCFFDIPEIAEEASRAADAVRSKYGNCDTDYQIHLRRDHREIYVDVYCRVG